MLPDSCTLDTLTDDVAHQVHQTHLLKLDLAHNFHPCTQMKDHELFPPLIIQKASGSYFYTSDGRPIIDGISSWWCKSFGHNHPRLKKP